MTVSIRSQKYHDSMGRTRRTRVWFRYGMIAVGVAVIGVGLVWVFFVSSVFAIQDVHVQGAERTGNDAVAASVHELLSQKKLYVLEPLRNIVLLHSSAVEQYIQSQYPGIQEAQITKHYLHELTITVTERQSIGTWCRGDDCEFFDRSGTRWGQALQSSGPLLLLVKDDRSEDVSDPRMFTGMLAAVDGLAQFELTAKTITLPDAEPGGIVITTTKGYDLYIDAEGNVADQLAVLGVFLSDKAKDPAFAPHYIDLRTPGRVYYK